MVVVEASGALEIVAITGAVMEQPHKEPQREIAKHQCYIRSIGDGVVGWGIGHTLGRRQPWEIGVVVQRDTNR
jgi:hypothetical protein